MSKEMKKDAVGAAESIPEPVKKRLPSYYRMLLKLYAEGYLRISSDELASAMGFSPSQVRGDMLAVGCSGQKGYGYLITKLYNRIGEVLCIQDSYCAVMIGGGSLAEALSGCHLFTKRGVKLIGSFPTVDEAAIADFCRERRVDIMILACDAGNAARLASLAEELGVPGIWNFSDTDISSERVAVRNVHFEDSLMLLCSEITKKQR